MAVEWSKAAELAVTAGATLAAAYWGARAAFTFNLRQEIVRERRHQVEECNRAMLVLMRQYNQLANYREQFLDPVRSDQGRHLRMPPSRHPDYSAWTVNVPALSFLVQTEATELRLMLALADQHFHGATAAMTMRSELHFEFQRRMEHMEDDKRALTLAEVHEAIGDRLATTLLQATDQLYELVDGAIQNHEKVGRDARLVLQTLYRGSKIIGFGPDPNRARKVG